MCVCVCVCAKRLGAKRIVIVTTPFPVILVICKHLALTAFGSNFGLWGVCVHDSVRGGGGGGGVMDMFLHCLIPWLC